MGIDDFFDFDDDAYRTQINSMDEAELRREHYIIRQKCLSSAASAGLGIATAAHTMGASLFLSGIGFRRNHYNDKKQHIIEERMNKMGWETSDLRKRDLLMAFGPSVITAGAAPGIEHVTSSLAGNAAAHFTASHAGEAASMAIHNTTPFIHAAEQGFEAHIEAVANGLTGHAVQLVPIESVATNTPEFFGSMAGQGLASTAELQVTKTALGKAAKIALDRKINPPVSQSDSTAKTKTVLNPLGESKREEPRGLRRQITSRRCYESSDRSELNEDKFEDAQSSPLLPTTPVPEPGEPLRMTKAIKSREKPPKVAPEVISEGYTSNFISAVLFCWSIICLVLRMSVVFFVCLFYLAKGIFLLCRVVPKYPLRTIFAVILLCTGLIMWPRSFGFGFIVFRKLWLRSLLSFWSLV